jgi:hypothetical protein
MLVVSTPREGGKKRKKAGWYEGKLPIEREYFAY